jgi:hypothetical protein
VVYLGGVLLAQLVGFFTKSYAFHIVLTIGTRILRFPHCPYNRHADFTLPLKGQNEKLMKRVRRRNMAKWQYLRFTVNPSGDIERQATFKVWKAGEPHPSSEELQKHPPTVAEMLSDLGEQGWELVAVDQSNNYIFKRFKPRQRHARGLSSEK